MDISIKDKYSGCQTMFKTAYESSCHFLSILSIADEENKRLNNGKPGIDFLEARVIAQTMTTPDGKKWMSKDFTVTVAGALAILEYYTDRKWTRRKVINLPDIRENEYTEAIWYNDRTKYRHYRRRYMDTLVNSVTVEEGHIIGYYIYTSEG